MRKRRDDEGAEEGEDLRARNCETKLSLQIFAHSQMCILECSPERASERFQMSGPGEIVSLPMLLT